MILKLAMLKNQVSHWVRRVNDPVDSGFSFTTRAGDILLGPLSWGVGSLSGFICGPTFVRIGGLFRGEIEQGGNGAAKISANGLAVNGFRQPRPAAIWSQPPCRNNKLLPLVIEVARGEALNL